MDPAWIGASVGGGMAALLAGLGIGRKSGNNHRNDSAVRVKVADDIQQLVGEMQAQREWRHAVLAELKTLNSNITVMHRDILQRRGDL